MPNNRSIVVYIDRFFGQEIRMNHRVKKKQKMTKDNLLVFTLVVSSVSVFLFGILLFMVLIFATHDWLTCEHQETIVF
jgi:hypothetical protein